MWQNSLAFFIFLLLLSENICNSGVGEPTLELDYCSNIPQSNSFYCEGEHKHHLLRDNSLHIPSYHNIQETFVYYKEEKNLLQGRTNFLSTSLEKPISQKKAYQRRAKSSTKKYSKNSKSTYEFNKTTKFFTYEKKRRLYLIK